MKILSSRLKSSVRPASSLNGGNIQIFPVAAKYYINHDKK